VSDTVLYELRGPSAWITLNRPDKLNAIDAPMVEALRGRLAEAVEDDGVRIVVLAGAGRAFSAGYDIGEEIEYGYGDVETWREVLQRDLDLAVDLWALPKPTIAAVHGWCLGGACELAMACDMVVASDDARFGEPEIRYGSGPVALLMPFVLGQKKTSELLFTGDSIDAEEALRVGLVNRVVPAADLPGAVDELIAKIAPTPLETLRITKTAITRAYEAMGIRTALAANLELSAILNSLDRPEQREFDRIAREEGLRAALSWRDARYRGGSLEGVVPPDA
jgi:enoyl-CoA hydratase